MAESKKEVVPESVRSEEGAALRRLLDASQFNQQTLAAESGVGTKAMVWQMMSGHRPLNLDAATRLARTLGVEIDAFSPRLAHLIREAATLVAQTPSADYTVKVTPPPIPISRTAESSRGYGWPFPSLTPDQFFAISEASRSELEAIARGMAIEAGKRGKSGTA